MNNIYDNFIFFDNIKKFEDNRGVTYQNYNNLNINFVQELHSISKKNVIRGLHYQWDKPLGKLIRVSKGSIIDIIVDIRKDSKNFGKYYKFYLSDVNLNQLWIPPCYAHGFLSLEDETHVQYKFTEYYNKDGESNIFAFDKEINIDWGISRKEAILSERDSCAQSFIEYKKNFRF